MALNGGGSIVDSNTKTLTAWSIDTFHRGDVTNWGSTELFSTMDPQMLQPPLEQILCSAYLLSILVTGMTDQPSNVIWMVILQSLLPPANISDHDRQRVEVYLARKWGLLSIMPSPVPSPSDASKNPYVSTIGGNSVTTSVPLVDDGGEDAMSPFLRYWMRD